MGAQLVQLLLLLSLHCLSVDLVTGASLQTSRELLPCTQLFDTVSLNKSILIAVPRNLSFCLNSTVNETDHGGRVVGLRISTRLEIAESDSEFAMHMAGDDGERTAVANKPVVFTARQFDNNGFVSWTTPLNHSSKLFQNVSHTMCPVKNFALDSDLPLLYIDAFSSSESGVNFSVEVEPVENFVLKINETYTVDIDPASPQIYYFKIPDNVSLVTIETIASYTTKGCTIVSVQNNTCPVNDLLDNARSKGFYQTMATSAFLTINSDTVVNREFLLVLVATDLSLCYGKATNDTDSKPRTVTIKVNIMKPTSEYIWAMFLPVVFCAVLYCLSVIVCCCYAPRCEPLSCKCLKCPQAWRSCRTRIRPCRCVCCLSTGDETQEINPNETTIECSKGLCFCVCCKRNIPKPDCTTPKEASVDDDNVNESQPLVGSVNLSGSVSDYGAVGAGQHSGASNTALEVPVDQRGQQNVAVGGATDQTQTSYNVYSWNTVTVGIFYALPALQLVFSEQKILDQSGDQDTCYYNFKCAHPVWFFSAFNNMWSNIGYILLGILFVLIVFFRHWQYIVRRNKNKAYVDSHGVPQSFGIYYAMGFALVLEGFMSSFYHICPSNANFQFDTAFMFITGGIILVKVYQNRHPHIQVNAFIAFFTFAVIIFFTLIGIYNDKHHPLSVKISFLFLALVVTFLFLAHFYRWNFSLDQRKEKEMFDKCNCGFQLSCISGCCSGLCLLVEAVGKWLLSLKRWKDFCKQEKYRIIKHIIIIITSNIVLGVCMFVFYKGIATIVLIFFVSNIVLCLFIYLVIKFCYGEPWTLLALLLPLVIGAFWLVAFCFYGTVTEWKETPALSRSMNMECYVEGFYDYHDVWHFFSACGMFFAFLFVLVIDDGVVDEPRKRLLERAV